MTVKVQLLEEIRNLRDNYLEIERIIPFEVLLGEDVAVHPNSKELLARIEKVLNGSKKVENILKKWVLQEKKALLVLPDDNKLFVETVVRPRYQKIRELFIRYHPNGWWEEFIGEVEQAEVGKESTEIVLTLIAALNYYDETVDEDDERRVDIFDFSGADEVVNSPYFTPDRWRSNARVLQPVTQREQDALIPSDVRRRLEATYASFIFGNWLACISMARAALEYALRTRARTLRMDVKSSKQSGMDAGLNELIRQVADQGYSDLFEPMDSIRKQANAVMHPSKFSPGVDESLAIIRYLKKCIEVLFAN